MIKSVLCVLLGMMLLAAPAQAQLGGEPPLLSDGPRCFTLINASGHTSIGTVSTRRYVAPDGKSSFFSDNFRLADGERKEVCASGPFYQGYTLELRLRSLIPLWTCYVPTDGQELRILSRKTADGTTKVFADCKASWE